jgi:LDH2 family malate/lactate/ureidoglycolate dehydrogenase
MNDTTTSTLFSEAVLRRQAAAILAGWGVPDDDLEATVDVLIDSDLRGVDSHGISLLALLAGWLKGGGYDLKARPRIERESASHALIDAGNNLGFAVSVFATNLAVRKARGAGMAAVAVRRSHHFGAAGYYARRAAREGMVSLVATSTKVVCVVPPGGSAPVIGTNPLAYGIPTGSGEPIVFDMATSTAAGNKVRVHHLRNQPIPEGWVVDAKGAAVTDPHAAFKLVYDGTQGGLTPLGATPTLGVHKGYGLALLVHFLGGALAGGTFAGARAKGDTAEDNIGHFFLAIDPAIFRPFDAFAADVGVVANTLRAAPAVDPARPVLMPGDIETKVHAQRKRDGIALPATLIEQLRAIAKHLGVAFHLDRA